MRRTNVRARVIREARRDAAAYFREFQAPVGASAPGWVTEAWSDLRRDFKLSAEVAESLWPLYWDAFSQEAARLELGR
jgi:hypothetical protein